MERIRLLFHTLASALECKVGAFDSLTVEGTVVTATVDGRAAIYEFGKWTPDLASAFEGVLLKHGYAPTLVWRKP